MQSKIRHQRFDTSKLKVLPLEQREHDLDISVIKRLDLKTPQNMAFERVAEDIVCARKNRAAVILMIGAHVLRSGVQRYLIDLMEKGYITCLAMNGACAIHDFEFALLGKTTENVGRYISNGQFGLWRETGRINDIVGQASLEDIGLGEAVGREISEGDYLYKDISVFAAGYRIGIVLTVHASIGYDIVHEHPNCDGAAWGKTTYTDFLRFANVLESLESGVVMNFGSAVMAPEVFLKALAMVRNVAEQENRTIKKFTSLVCDLQSLPGDFHSEAPKQSPYYYFRPWKTMLVRAVADGGKGYYVQGKHSETIPQLWTAIKSYSSRKRDE